MSTGEPSAAGEDAGVVEQHVEPAVGALGLGDRGLDLRRDRDVDRDEARAPAGRLDRGDRLASGGRLAIGDDHVRALGREQPRRLAPDPAPGARDQRRAPREPAVACAHIPSSVSK